MPGNAVTVRLKSPESPFSYTTKKNPRNVTKKLELRRYDPILRKHLVFKEEKVK